MKTYHQRVLMLVENDFPTDTRVWNEASTLAANGYQVTVIAVRQPGQKAREVINGITVYRIPKIEVFKKLPTTERSGFKRLGNKLGIVVGYLSEYVFFTLACLLLSIYVAVREGFDVVHAHNPPDTLFVVGGFHRLFGKKFVFDHHDLSPELYLSRYNITDGLVSRVLKLFEKWSVKLADVAIATNESYSAINVQRNGIDAERVFVVRNGPNLQRVKLVEPDRALLSRGVTILGYVGAMNPQDGLDYLLRALHHLVHDLKRTDFYCVAIGDGDSLEELRELAVKLGVADHVWFTGFIPVDDLMRYLSTADICLDPNPSSPLNDVSTWIKVMEYMALGKPIVSFDLKETRVSAGNAAVYVKPNDELEYARAIAELIDDPEKRRKMGKYGTARVHEALTWSVTSKNLLAAYSVLFPEKHGKSVQALVTKS